MSDEPPSGGSSSLTHGPRPTSRASLRAIAWPFRTSLAGRRSATPRTSLRFALTRFVHAVTHPHPSPSTPSPPSVVPLHSAPDRRVAPHSYTLHPAHRSPPSSPVARA